MEKAIEKLRAEMEEQKDNIYTQYIGEYLLKYISENPQYSGNIIKTDKNIAGSLNYMSEKAKERARDGMAIFTPEEGFAIVLDYFEINEGAAPVLSVVKPNTNTKKKNISLDDLL